jgi:pimeloyl-ACP methyl ester carboxylesterase
VVQSFTQTCRAPDTTEGEASGFKPEELAAFAIRAVTHISFERDGHWHPDICSRVLPKVTVMLRSTSLDMDVRPAAARSQTLADQAALIEAVLPEHATDVGLVGHSFGASVAMRAAAHLGSRVSRLVLLEPNPFYLLRDNGRMEAFGEAARLRDMVKTHGTRGEWSIAAQEFADYWGGSGTWTATTPDRRATFVEALKLNFHEWDAIMNERTSLIAWSAQLPAKTLIVDDTNTVRPIREIVELMRDATTWQTTTIARGGHMAPLSHPDLVNPIVAKFLQD